MVARLKARAGREEGGSIFSSPRTLLCSQFESNYMRGSFGGKLTERGCGKKKKKMLPTMGFLGGGLAF